MTALCHISELPENGCLGFEVSRTKLFIVRKYGEYFAYLNRCPHQQITLDWDNHQFLDDEAELIQCSSHAAMFDIRSGRCVSGPCIHESLQALSITIIDDQLCVDEQELKLFRNI